MNEMNDMVGEAAARLFRDACDDALRMRTEEGGWPQALWDGVVQMGLAAAWPGGLQEDALDTAALMVLARTAGRHAVPLPLGENLIARRALRAAGLAGDEGVAPLSIAACPGELRLVGGPGQWRLQGRLARVPWGRFAHAVVAVAQVPTGWRTVRIDLPQAAQVELNCAHEPRDSYGLSGLELPDAAVGAEGRGPTAGQLYRQGALLRAAQIAGAVEAVLNMTLTYAHDRVQFGRPIAQFQAIQHQVAVMASQAAAATAAVQAAAMAGDDADFEAAAAKLRASEAAGHAIHVAHQVHGAMGFTHEHPLHFHTRRLLAWRDEFGSEAEWGAWIGERVARVGGDNLWDLVVSPGRYRLLSQEIEREKEVSHA